MLYTNLSSSLSLGSILLLTFLLICKLRAVQTHLLRCIPGPTLASLTDIPYSYWSLSGRKDFIILSLHAKYGPVVRVAPNELSFNSAQSWRDIYGGHPPFQKSALYDGAWFANLGVYGITTSRDEDQHSLMRKYLAPAFSHSALRAQEGLVAEHVDELIGWMREKSIQGSEIMDLEVWMRMCTFDITGSLAFGQGFNALKNSQHPAVRFINGSLRQVSLADALRRYPYLRNIIALVFSRTLLKLMHGMKMFESFALTTIRHRLANPLKRPDFLTRIQENLDPSSPHPIVVQIAAHAGDFMSAGSDTSNTTVGTVLNYALRSPDLYNRLTTEIRTKFKSYQDINAQDAAALPFLKLLILEALRI
ncbi:cytochrome P450 [Lindgomyces ingoldianus]|uniref:Cytochrome P450 n=1 Tax=Lindgomyces ingoldianus TaxID=673940 RepID=A0ACB6R0R3_9PLEO|nr:cytochrome P450 [Lindgomyces ingoldianus]KAF2472771.1 cytochrome P450 [Lindgomyces ingoldianus]